MFRVVSTSMLSVNSSPRITSSGAHVFSELLAAAIQVVRQSPAALEIEGAGETDALVAFADEVDRPVERLRKRVERAQRADVEDLRGDAERLLDLARSQLQLVRERPLRKGVVQLDLGSLLAVLPLRLTDDAEAFGHARHDVEPQLHLVVAPVVIAREILIPVGLSVSPVPEAMYVDSLLGLLGRR
jgi:hypothetical protein